MKPVLRAELTQPIILIVPYGQKISAIPNVQWVRGDDAKQCFFVRVRGLDTTVK